MQLNETQRRIEELFPGVLKQLGEYSSTTKTVSSLYILNGEEVSFRVTDASASSTYRLGRNKNKEIILTGDVRFLPSEFPEGHRIHGAYKQIAKREGLHLIEISIEGSSPEYVYGAVLTSIEDTRYSITKLFTAEDRLREELSVEHAKGD